MTIPKLYPPKKPSIAVAMRVRDEMELLPWILANIRYADTVYVADGGSVDGSWEWLQDRAKTDGRLKLARWSVNKGWYCDQGDHLRFLFGMTRDRHWPWIQLIEPDNVPSVAFQEGIGEWLGRVENQTQVGDYVRVGVRMNELYLAPGWETYYKQVSQYKACYLWNHVPEITGDDSTIPLFTWSQPDQFVDAPEEFTLFHWNWALQQRFNKKQQRYLGSPPAHGQIVSWHPEERFHDNTPLPGYAEWYSPKGKVVGPLVMKRWFP